MPKSWDNTNLSTYIEIIDSVQNVDDTFELLSIVFDIPMSELDSMPYDDVLIMENDVKYVFTPITTPHKDKLTLKGHDFYLLPFEKLEFGAFIDLEHLFNDNYLYNLPKIYSILYRGITTEGDELNKPVYEKYGDWLDVRDSVFESCMIGDVFSIITHYLKFKTSIYTTYEGLFQEKEEEMNEQEELEILRDMTGKEREEYYNEKNVAGYGWELMLLRLSNNDPTKMLEVSSMSLYQALNILGMMKNLKMG